MNIFIKPDIIVRYCYFRNVWSIQSGIPANNSTKHIHLHIFILRTPKCYWYNWFWIFYCVICLYGRFVRILLNCRRRVFSVVSIWLSCFFKWYISPKWTKRKLYRSNCWQLVICYWLLVRLIKCERLIYCLTVFFGHV